MTRLALFLSQPMLPVGLLRLGRKSKVGREWKKIKKEPVLRCVAIQDEISIFCYISKIGGGVDPEHPGSHSSRFLMPLLHW